jgi:hypothetical protein
MTPWATRRTRSHEPPRKFTLIQYAAVTIDEKPWDHKAVSPIWQAEPTYPAAHEHLPGALQVPPLEQPVEQTAGRMIYVYNGTITKQTNGAGRPSPKRGACAHVGCCAGAAVGANSKANG